MTPLIYVPVEPLQERYTEQWLRLFPPAFTEVGFEVQTILGTPLEDEVKVGAFLDVNSTVHYKCSQLMQIAALFNQGKVAQGTVFFFGDIEFWGLESVRLMADMNNIKVRITGFLHAASHTIEDAFSIAAPYQRFTEVGWVAALDKVFVGSAYAKQAFIDRRIGPDFPELNSKIIDTKNPVFTDEYPVIKADKQKKILLTNRFDEEKRPIETLSAFAVLKERFPDWEFVVTTGRSSLRGSADVSIARQLESQGIITIKDGLTKAQYHQELAEAYAMMSHSIEENYGYCIAEAIHYKCIPILRDGLSHNDFVMPLLRFTNIPESITVATSVVNTYGTSIPPLWNVYPLDTGGLARITNELKEYL